MTIRKGDERENSSPPLPGPVVAPRRRRYSSSKRQGEYDFLIRRARTTNLAVLLLFAIACVSLLVNLRLWLGEEVRPS
jgi:hypothetical protein